MKISSLEQILKDSIHAGSQSSELLDKFLLYAKLVQDPLNVFRYMEEKSICTYFPLFWFTKSEYLAELGDYKNAFVCLKQAQSRLGMNEEDQNQKIIDPKIKAKQYRDLMSNEMLKYPSQKKRSIADFQLSNKKFQDIPGTDEQKNQQIAELIENKFSLIKLQKEKKFYQKNEQKPKSWLYEHYENQKEKIFEIIHQTFKIYGEKKDESEGKLSPGLRKISQNHQRLFKSVNTPFKRRDPMRMVKTVDSVEMMKRKKKNSNQKKYNFLKSPEEKLMQNSEQEEDIFDSNQSRSLLMNTMPVGGKFGELKNKKQVKFQRQSSNLQFEKIRKEPRAESNEIEVSRKTSVHKKGILRKKSTEAKKNILIDKESSFKIKQCQQNDI